MRQLVVVTGIAALVAAAVPAAAQYQPPQCELNTGHFLVNGAVVYIKGAAEEADSQESRRMLNDARRNLLEAIGRGEEENPAVWYFLGRYYKEVSDGVGADSTFDRAADLAPECQEDIAYHRQVMWVPIVNRGIDSLREGNFEAAKQSFREANHVWRQDPIASYYLGRIFGSEGDTVRVEVTPDSVVTYFGLDSAIAYLKDAVAIGVTDTARAEPVQDAHRSIGLLYTMLAQRGDATALWDSAATWFRSYLGQWPGDPDAMIALAQAYDGAGRERQARAAYDSVLANAEEMRASALFEVGTKMFREQSFEVAGRAFEAGLAKNPYSRDALFNLANTYLVLEDAQSMLSVARRLEAVDPRNQESVRLLAGAHQMLNNRDSSLAWLEHVNGMRWEVLIDFAEHLQSGYSVSGRIRNLVEAPVQVPAVTFEFLDAEGNVLATETIAAQSVPADGAASFEFTVPDEGVVAWRYRAAS